MLETFPRRPHALLMRVAALLCILPVLPSCGAGSGTASHLPAGPTTNAAPGDLVLYVAMAQGDRVDAYRLGADGLLPANPFDTIFMNNPRRLALADGVLHVAAIDRIVSLELGADGSLPNTPTAESRIDNRYEPNEIEVRNDILYVAAQGVGRVESYELNEDHLVTELPTGAGVNTEPSDYLSLEFNGNFLYSGSRRNARIDVFALEPDGNVPEFAEQVEPEDRIALPDDLVIRDGILYTTSGGDKSIRAYRLRNDGTLPDEHTTRTPTEEFYSSILLSGDLMYVSAYNAGRIDTYRLAGSGLPIEDDGPMSSTQDDPASYPNELLLHGGIIYVAQAGLDRVDAFVIDQDGFLPRFPSSSTAPFPNDSFPSDLVLLNLDE